MTQWLVPSWQPGSSFDVMTDALPGVLAIPDGLKSIPNVLMNKAIAVTALAGSMGSASGGMGIT
jgi:H+/gluconate symporter-like permease